MLNLLECVFRVSAYMRLRTYGLSTIHTEAYTKFIVDDDVKSYFI